MKLKITLSNPGGELGSRTITADDEEMAGRLAAMAVKELIDEAGSALLAGDTITVEEIAESVQFRAKTGRA